MADNRKKRPNYAESLAAPSKLTEADSQESVEVDVGGQPVKILRGDMTDKEWAMVKSRALPTEDKTLKSKELGWSELMSMGQNLDTVADSLVSKEQKDLLKKTDEWTRAEYLRNRMRQKGYTVPPNSAEDERASYKDGKKTPTTDVGVQKPAQGSPDEWKSVPAPRPQPQSSPGTQTEDDAMVGSADPGMSVRGQMARLATGATGNPMLDAIGSRAGEVADTASKAAAAGKAAQDNALKPAAQALGLVPTGETLDPYTGKMTAPEPVRDELKDSEPAKPAFGGTLEALGNFVGYEPRPNQQEMAAREDLGLDPLTAQPAPQQPAPPVATPQPPPVDPSQQIAASLAATMPGGFTPVGVDPAAKKATADALKQAQEGAAALKDTVASTTESQQRLLDDTVRLHRQKMDEGELLAKEAADIQRTHVEQAARMTAAKTAVLERARQAAMTPTDPNRYWNNKTDGQKAMSIVAGALFGWTGQGMQWLQRLDGLVEADMNAQRADRASAVQGLQAEAQGYGEAAREALAQGATLAEARLIEKSAKYESAKSYLEQFQMSTQNAQFKLRAAEMLQGIDQAQFNVAAQLQQLAQGEANMINHARAQNAQLQQGKMSAMAKILQGGKGAEDMPPGIRTELARIEAGLEAVRQAREAAGNGSLTERMWDQLKLNVSKVMPTSAANALMPDLMGRNYTARSAQENVLKAVKGENLLETDIARAEPRWIGPGLNAENKQWLDSNEEQLLAKKNALLQSNKESGIAPQAAPLRTLTR